jgi:PAS domain-containing protein
VHKLLARQIAKATNEAGSIDLEKLFALVADAYADLDRDRRRTDRSMSLMIEEIDAVQRNLEHMVIERTRELREREAELQAQNLRFEAAISNMSQGLVMFDTRPGSSSATTAFSPCTASRATASSPATRCCTSSNGASPMEYSPATPSTMRTICGPWSKRESGPRGSSS